jgi:hypothetical protein
MRERVLELGSVPMDYREIELRILASMLHDPLLCLDCMKLVLMGESNKCPACKGLRLVRAANFRKLAAEAEKQGWILGKDQQVDPPMILELENHFKDSDFMAQPIKYLPPKRKKSYVSPTGRTRSRAHRSNNPWA